jgi:hypothetical protein
MRIVGFLLAAAALLSTACTTATSPDEDCITQGGICFLSQGACTSPVSAACSSGYSCCADPNAFNVRDGGTYDAGPAPVVVTDAGADGARDAAHEAAHEAGHDAAATTDSGKSDAKDAGKTG